LGLCWTAIELPYELVTIALNLWWDTLAFLLLLVLLSLFTIHSKR